MEKTIEYLSTRCASCFENEGESNVRCPLKYEESRVYSLDDFCNCCIECQRDCEIQKGEYYD